VDLVRASGLCRQKPELHAARLSYVERELARVSNPAYLDELVGTLGADPFEFQGGSGEQLASAAE
jgi:hypothetical protein